MEIQTVNTFAAFLRGVMPSGRNAVKMADVRKVLGEHGFSDVRTWIQSGNIALRSPDDAPGTARRIHALLHEHLGVDLAVIVKEPRHELQAILDANPFSGDDYDIRRVFFTLSNTPLVDTAGLNERDFGEDRLCIQPQAAYLYIPGDASRSKLGNAFLEKQLGLRLTTRNFNTLSKMTGF